MKLPSRTNIILFIISLVLLAIVIGYANPAKIIDTFKTTNPTSILFALTLIIGTAIINGARFHALAKEGTSITFKEAVQVVSVGQLINQGIVGMLGEVAKGLILKKKHGIEFAKTVGLIWVERSQDILFTLAFVSFITSEFYGTGMIAPIIFTIAIFTIWAVLPRFPLAVIKRISFKKVEQIATSFIIFIRSISRKTIVYTLLMTLVAFLVTGVANQIILEALGVRIGLVMVMGATFASLLIGVISGMPGGIGSREAAMTAIYGHVGVPVAIAVSASIIFRVLVIVSYSIIYAVTRIGSLGLKIVNQKN